ncbi:MAG TPA: DoxX subfamily [Porphyromonadaceae bacterium]|jgi:thiosulfate dehydrogenase [quinone] large subunit|nr:DoxX subfamily [Porphyromonadaceae bacterium]
MKNNLHFVYAHTQLVSLVTLRVLIGWYFLYEGLAKILTPNWTSYGYLVDAHGLFAPVFKLIAENPNLLAMADTLNVYGLTIVGLLFILGLFNKAACVGAISFLALYYLAHPPLIGASYIFPTEGSYLWVDKNLIMLGAVIVLLFFPTSGIIGLDRIIFKRK